ncbi:MAG: hypothetical protein ABJH57_01915 [Cyclobacteriaceae bacterium]
MSNDLLLGLDADEIFAARDNLEAAVRLRTGPKARRIPEGLCVEVDQLLYLLELAVRKSQEISDS